MRQESLVWRAALVVAIAALGFPRAAAAQAVSATPRADSSALRIPPSVRAEHSEIHAALEATTRTPGRVGSAARRLATVLEPHFRREEQIALPPLGLLAPLAARTSLQQTDVVRALAMTDSLRTELPAMLREHVAIRAAVAQLRAAARTAHDAKAERLAEQLALHAQTEEQVFYPAAVLAGELIRARAH